jgi:hypothetical protein
MGRIRTVKPEFNSHESLSALSCQAHLMAEALLCYADDEGYFNANPGLVRANTCPLRDDFKDVRKLLAELAKVGYLRFGVTADGKRFGHIVHFLDHQKISHPSPSKISNKEILWEGSGKIPEDSRKALDILRPEQGTGNGERGTGKGNRELLPPGGDRNPIVSDSEFDFEDRADPVAEEQMEMIRMVKSLEEAMPPDATPIPPERRDAIREIFVYYLVGVGRKSRTYTLTKKRRSMANARLELALTMCQRSLPDAIELMKGAIDQLTLSDFHMGRSDRSEGKRWCDFEHVFRSDEQFQKWLQIALEQEGAVHV